MSTPNPKLEATTTIDAPAEAVWAHLSDPRVLGGLSPQVVRSTVQGSAPVGVGTRFLNVNRDGWKVWPTRAVVTRYEPNRALAFKVKENGAVWSFDLEPAEGGTRVVHRRELPAGVTKTSVLLQDKVLGGVAPFEASLERGMALTLQRLAAAVAAARV